MGSRTHRRGSVFDITVHRIAGCQNWGQHFVGGWHIAQPFQNSFNASLVVWHLDMSDSIGHHNLQVYTWPVNQ